MQDGRPYNDISLLETADDLYTAEDNAAPACLPPKGFVTFLNLDFHSLDFCGSQN